ncbi:MAG: YraN family protein [Acidiferrobacterales bacterium]
MKAKQAQHLRQGLEAEQCAYAHLQRQGLRLITRNYRTPFGEIDLIMEQSNTIVFVEVRYRRSKTFGTPAETVGARKQEKLRASAGHYLQRNRKISKKPCRFDIVAVTGAPDSNQVEWLQDAF